MDRYWFVTVYLMMYALFPFLNRAIHAMNRQQHRMCCCALVLVFSVLPNFAYVSDFTGVRGGSSLLWFATLYILAAYFRLYVPERIKQQKWMLPGYLLCCLLICGERFLAYAVTPKVFGTVKLASFFYAKNSILTLAASLLLLQFFRGLHIHGKFTSKIIGFTAPLTFAVYLLHDNPTLRPVLWSWIDLPAGAESPLLIVRVLLTAVCIFTICCLIEFVRKWLFEKLRITGTVHHLCDKIQNYIMIRMHLS